MHKFSFQILAGKILHNINHYCHVYSRRLEKRIMIVHHGNTCDIVRGALALAGFFTAYINDTKRQKPCILEIKLLSESIVFFVTKRSNIK